MLIMGPDDARAALDLVGGEIVDGPSQAGNEWKTFIQTLGEATGSRIFRESQPPESELEAEEPPEPF